MTRSHHKCSTLVQPSVDSIAVSQESLQRSEMVFRGVVAFVAIGLLALFAGNAFGQAGKYKVLQVEDLIDKNLATVQREARGYATARDISAFAPNRAAVVQRYFSQYVPAKITQPDSLHQINQVMGHAQASMDSAIRSRTQAAGNVMRWLYGGLKPVAVGNYQPAARINAIQFISKLARPSAQRGGIPKPYEFVLADMRGIFSDEANPDAVRAAALKGIDHFVRFTPPNDPAINAAKAELVQEMTALLQSDPPAGRDDLAHAFLQRYAVNILTNLSTDASLGKEFVSLSIDENKPDLIALHSAAAIANLPGKLPEGDVETKKVLMEWSKRMLAAYDGEIARLREMDKTLSIGGTKKVTQPAGPETYLERTEQPKNDRRSRSGASGGGMMGDMMEMEYENEDMMGMDMEQEMGMGDMMMMMGGSGGGMGARGGSMEQEQPPEVVASRKKLNYVVQQVLLGVTGEAKTVEDVDAMTPKGGLLASTKGDELADAKEWLGSVMDMTTQLNDKTLGSTKDFVKSLEAQKEILAALAEGKAVDTQAVLDNPVFGFGDDPLESGAPATESGPPADAEPNLEDELEGLIDN